MGATKDTKIDIEVYNGVVDEIETQNDTVIEDGFVATSASSIISTNATVPTFVTADENVVSMLTNLKVQVQDVITTMRDVRDSMDNVNTDAKTSGEKYNTGK
ncbi:hypothetical protein [Pseudobutyrivibrio ruminis]|jgi:hypothetical protein|uniref:hypothetical protein n=1 Tax=Pseudobutyrivibrio ruminis TaxID=46206 RepID=UPI00042294AE|nr:hypothetical protein [Pseudobutyrivibrio ruminis]